MNDPQQQRPEATGPAVSASDSDTERWWWVGPRRDRVRDSEGTGSGREKSWAVAELTLDRLASAFSFSADVEFLSLLLQRIKEEEEILPFIFLPSQIS